MSTLLITQGNEIKSYGYVQIYLYLYCLFLQLKHLDIFNYSCNYTRYTYIYMRDYTIVILVVGIFCLFCLDMNNTPSLNEINKTANMNPNLSTRRYKLNLMNDFMYIKYQNPKMKQSEITNQLNLSSSTLQRFRNDINMLSPYRISANNTKKQSKKALDTDFKNNSHHKPDDKRPQMTSNDLKTNQTEPNKKKIYVLKAGSVQEIIEINEHYLDELLDNNNI